MGIRSACPPDRALHGLSCVLMADRILWTLVESHKDVAAEGELHVYGRLGCEGMGIAIEVGAEDDALLGNLAQAGETEDLESAGVGEDRAGPGHEAMQSAEPPDQLVAGTKVKVIGVAEHD